MQALLALSKSGEKGGLPARTIGLVQIRASQIKGGAQGGETDERLFAVAAWRRCDRADPVPDAIWDDATRHYDEAALAALIISIATINAWNRLNVATRQVAAGEKGFR